jgi:hypothetical protein
VPFGPPGDAVLLRGPRLRRGAVPDSHPLQTGTAAPPLLEEAVLSLPVEEGG